MARRNLKKSSVLQLIGIVLILTSMLWPLAILKTLSFTIGFGGFLYGFSRELKEKTQCSKLI